MTARSWPPFRGPADLLDVESVPLAERNLPESTYALVCEAEAHWPERPALNILPGAAQWEQPEVWTFSDVARAVRQCANAFAAEGISGTDAVTLMSANTGLMLTAMLGAQVAGVAAPVNPALRPDAVTELARASRAKVIVAAGPELDHATWVNARAAAEAVPVSALYALRPDGVRTPAPQLTPLPGVKVAYLEHLLQSQPDDRLICPQPAPSVTASAFHTGGTTGAPKLAAHTHANEVAMAWSLALLLSDAPERSTVLAGLPLFHVNAFLVTGLAPMFRGHPVLWLGPAGFRDPAVYQYFWKIVEHHQIAAMSAVPTVYGVLADTSVDADISSLRIAAVGATPLPAAVRQRWFARTGVALREGYGLTEAACVSAAAPSNDAPSGSVGLRLPYQRIVAVAHDEEGQYRELPAGQSGQLIIQGPNVFPGYLTARGTLDTGALLPDGALLTGDLGSVDADGHVYLAGRAKDIIIRGGHNIDPAAIEDAMLAHPAVTGAAAVGQPDEHSGEVPVVYVTTNGTADVEELRRWAQDTIAETAAVPKDVYLIAAIPLTPIGKPYKPMLRCDAANRAVHAALIAASVAVDPSTRAGDRRIFEQAVSQPVQKSLNSKGTEIGHDQEQKPRG